MLCTHTGIKWHRALPDGRHVVNVGVIGRPENDGRTNVWYALLTARSRARRRVRAGRVRSRGAGGARWSGRGCRPSSPRRSAPGGGRPAWRSCPPASGREASTEQATAAGRPDRGRAGGDGAGARADRPDPARQRRPPAGVDRRVRGLGPRGLRGRLRGRGGRVRPGPAARPSLGGLVFGPIEGVVYSSIASTAGRRSPFSSRATRRATWWSAGWRPIPRSAAWTARWPGTAGAS